MAAAGAPAGPQPVLRDGDCWRLNCVARLWLEVVCVGSAPEGQLTAAISNYWQRQLTTTISNCWCLWVWHRQLIELLV